MNNELLKLFDIPDDAVEELLIDNKDSFYEISIWVKPSRTCCSRCNSIHFVRKGNKKDLLYQYLSTTGLLELSFTQKDIDAMTVNVHLKTLILLLMMTDPLPIHVQFSVRKKQDTVFTE